ncbi:MULTISPECIES: adenylate cyclase [unclassified Kitasatospora]|uniref:adenylate cyclase n=1 Tax=unclassified Kitasatospora TaxID=2633591 RepID=UPI00340136B1
MALEIERKFLVEGEHPAPGGEPRSIAQGYLTAPTDGTEVRLRRIGGKHVLGLKRGSGLVRTELETEIGEENFAVLWPATEGARVVKDRYTLALGEHTAYLDLYTEALAGLRTVEVEFASEAQARDFRPPAWFGREVTDDKAFKNQSLAVHGLPADEMRNAQ